MMELGATVCTPRAPRCGECPWAKDCRAFAQGIAESLPGKRKKRATVSIQVAGAVLLDPAGRTLLVREVNEGGGGELFSRMWQFPAVEVKRSAEAELARHLGMLFGLRTAKLIALPPARHAVTYRDITLLPFLVRVGRLPVPVGQAFLPVPASPRASVKRGQTRMSVPPRGAILTPALAQIERLATSSATRKIARAARQM
jgi:A/G-specific adenine glycosylase